MERSTIAAVNLILLERPAVSADGEATLTGAQAAHAIGVLKVTPGQPLGVGVIDGPRGTALVEAVGTADVRVRCTFEPAPPPVPAVDLLLAVPRPKVLRRLWAQLAALGVGRIILTNADRVERNYFDTHVLSPLFFRSVLVEGLQQARDTRLPIVTIHRQFRKLVEDELDALTDARQRLVADHRATTPIATAVRDRREGRVLLAVGPEGGWNAFELDLLASRGCRPVALGTRTLRVDTACVALLALVHGALDAAAS